MARMNILPLGTPNRMSRAMPVAVALVRRPDDGKRRIMSMGDADDTTISIKGSRAVINNSFWRQTHVAVLSGEPNTNITAVHPRMFVLYGAPGAPLTVFYVADDGSIGGRFVPTDDTSVRAPYDTFTVPGWFSGMPASIDAACTKMGLLGGTPLNYALYNTVWDGSAWVSTMVDTERFSDGYVGLSVENAALVAGKRRNRLHVVFGRAIYDGATQVGYAVRRYVGANGEFHLREAYTTYNDAATVPGYNLMELAYIKSVTTDTGGGYRTLVRELRAINEDGSEEVVSALPTTTYNSLYPGSAPVYGQLVYLGRNTYWLSYDVMTPTTISPAHWDRTTTQEFWRKNSTGGQWIKLDSCVSYTSNYYHAGTASVEVDMPSWFAHGEGALKVATSWNGDFYAGPVETVATILYEFGGVWRTWEVARHTSDVGPYGMLGVSMALNGRSNAFALRAEYANPTAPFWGDKNTALISTLSGTPEVVCTYNTIGAVAAPPTSLDGRTVIIMDNTEHTTTVWSAARTGAWEVVFSLVTYTVSGGVSLSADGRTMTFRTNSDTTMELWSCVPGAWVRIYRGPAGDMSRVNADGTWAFSAGYMLQAVDTWHMRVGVLEAGVTIAQDGVVDEGVNSGVYVVIGDARVKVATRERAAFPAVSRATSGPNKVLAHDDVADYIGYVLTVVMLREGGADGVVIEDLLPSLGQSMLIQQEPATGGDPIVQSLIVPQESGGDILAVMHQKTMRFFRRVRGAVF